MILVDVRIKNYKCILDSETFSIDQFDHYGPSMYLIRHPDVWKIEDIADALDRFERGCASINNAL